MSEKIKKEIKDLEKKLNQLKKHSKNFENEAKLKIIDKPLESVLISYGAGVLTGALIGALVGRRR